MEVAMEFVNAVLCRFCAIRHGEIACATVGPRFIFLDEMGTASGYTILESS